MAKNSNTTRISLPATCSQKYLKRFLVSLISGSDETHRMFFALMVLAISITRLCLSKGSSGRNHTTSISRAVIPVSASACFTFSVRSLVHVSKSHQTPTALNPALAAAYITCSGENSCTTPAARETRRDWLDLGFMFSLLRFKFALDHAIFVSIPVPVLRQTIIYRRLRMEST